MKHYVKCFYGQNVVYSKGWYCTLDYAPPLEVVFYDDNEGYCIGYTESELDYNALISNEPIFPISEMDTYMIILNSDIDTNGVYFGDKLLHRWDLVGGDYYSE